MSHRVLVTGAAGFVGRHVVHELQRRGHPVRATDRPQAALAAREGVEAMPCDLTRDPLEPLLRDVDTVVHVAGLFDLGAPPAQLHAVNVEAAARVARGAAAHGVSRFVHVSSVTVYGRPRAVPADEATPFRPGNPYERSKAEGERRVTGLLDAAGVPWVVVRPSGIYGPGGTYGLAVLMAAYALAGATGRPGGLVPFRGGPHMTHVHVDDVAGAIAHLLDAEGVTGRAFNVADDTPMPWGDLLGWMEREMNVRLGPPRQLSPRRARWMARLWRWMPESRRNRVNASVERRWAELMRTQHLVPALRPRFDRHAYDYWLGEHVYDHRALHAAGYTLRHPSLLDGLTTTLAWYREHQWLPPLS
jgi:nucleoside-diphosphate-sugar epimerase